MRLNSNLLYQELSKEVCLESYGPRKNDLLLGRPKFWLGEEALDKNQLYIIRSDYFPAYTKIGDGDLLVCVGGNPLSNCCSEAPALFMVHDSDILTVNNLLQDIFDRYEAWEREMQAFAEDGTDLQQFVERYGNLIGAPIIILDNDFSYIAYSKSIENIPEFFPLLPQNNVRDPHEMSEFFERYGTTKMLRQDVFVSESNGLNHVTKNILDNGTYLGSLNVYPLKGQKIETVTELAKILFVYAEKLFRKTVKHSRGYTYALKTIFNDILNCYPIEPVRMGAIRSVLHDTFFCLKLQISEKMQKVPLDYFCNNLETSLQGCVAFQFESYVVAFLNLTKLACTRQEAMEQVFRILPRSKVKIGISNSFRDISKAYVYYQEASVALETGKYVAEDKSPFDFDEYLLPYLLRESVGVFHLKFLLEEYLGSLLEHDKTSPVSYMETLRCYISNNMNMLKTSEELFLHRSTLNTRMSKIKQMIHLDWDNADDYLKLSILLKAQDIFICS